jgi:DNA gyrase/topoisomerase IV subunit B
MEETLELHEHIRKRPGMYIGNVGHAGVNYLITHILEELISEIGTDITSFELTISGDKVCSIEAKSKTGFVGPARLFTYEDQSPTFHRLYCKGLRGLCARLQVIAGKTNLLFSYGKQEDSICKMEMDNSDVLRLAFELDATIFKSFIFDFRILRNAIEEFALLNRTIAFIVRDNRGPHLNQNCFYFPEGIVHKLNWVCAEIMPPGYPVILIDTSINQNHYQIAIAWGMDVRYKDGEKVSYAGNYITSLNGSLIDGVIKGLHKALKKYALERGQENRISLHKLKRAYKLTIVAAVKAPELNYAGSTRWKLGMPEVEKQASEITMKSALTFFETNENVAKDMIMYSSLL